MPRHKMFALTLCLMAFSVLATVTDVHELDAFEKSDTKETTIGEDAKGAPFLRRSHRSISIATVPSPDSRSSFVLFHSWRFFLGVDDHRILHHDAGWSFR